MEKIALHTESEEDRDFLRFLYLSVRGPEFANVPWPEDVKNNFLYSQLQIQTQQYRKNYPEMERWIVLHDKCSIGRWYLLEAAAEIRIVDISLLPEWRGQGIGKWLLEDAQKRAESSGKPLHLQVEQHNPALHLYQRLGFHSVAIKEPYWLMEYRTASPVLS